MKCPKLRCCHKKKEKEEDDVEPLFVDPTERLGNFVRITELCAGAPTLSDEESETETHEYGYACAVELMKNYGLFVYPAAVHVLVNCSLVCDNCPAVLSDTTLEIVNFYTDCKM